MPAPETQPLILIVDPDPASGRQIDQFLRAQGFATARARSAPGAWRQMNKRPASLLLLDLDLPDFSATAFLNRLHKTQPHLPFMVMSARGSLRQAISSFKRGALDYLTKDRSFLKRLPGAIRRGLRQTQGALKQAHAAPPTKRQGTQRILHTEFAITRLFSQATPEDKAGPELLRVICQGLDWDLGELWTLDAKRQQLRRQATWQVSALKASSFNALGNIISLPRGTGLAGQVWASGQPTWLENLATDPNFMRTAAAAEAGLLTAFAFPIRHQTRVAAVLVFFSRQSRAPESHLLTAMSDLGRRIGNYIERLRAEAALRESESRLQALFEHSPAVLYLKDPEGRYLLVNHQFEKICGLPAHRIKGKRDSDLFSPDSARLFQANDQAVLAAKRPMKFEEWLPETPGIQNYLSVKFPLFDQTGVIYALCGISTDMTELKQLEREILRISEAEQRRLGQDLHDGLCQQLAGIEFISQALEQKLLGQGLPESASAGQIARLIREAITHTRDLAKGLSPVIMEPDGLMSSLKMLAANVSKLFQVDCRLRCPNPVLIRDNSMATHLFRIAQEAVNNAIRHGAAKRVEIRLGLTQQHILLSITDNGRGFASSQLKNKGMGLRIMQYRASEISGALSIQNNKRKSGASILCRVHHPHSIHEKNKIRSHRSRSQASADR